LFIDPNRSRVYISCGAERSCSPHNGPPIDGWRASRPLLAPARRCSWTNPTLCCWRSEPFGPRRLRSATLELARALFAAVIAEKPRQPVHDQDAVVQRYPKGDW
jgi:hypothetical protein